MVFETLGLVWGYVFVVVIASCSLIIGYYKGKGYINLPLRNPFGDKKVEKKEKKDNGNGEKKD